MKKSSKRRPKASRSRKQQAASAQRAAADSPVSVQAAVAQIAPCRPANASARTAKTSSREARPAPLTSTRRPRGATAAARPPAISADGRRVLAMLLVPFILVAVAAGFSQPVRMGARPIDLARTPSAAPPMQPPKPVMPPSVALAPSTAQPSILPRVAELSPALPQADTRPEPASPPAAPAILKSKAPDAPPLTPVYPAPASPRAGAPATIIAAASDTIVVPATGPAVSIPAARLPETEVAALLVPDPAPEPAASAAVTNVCTVLPLGLAKSAPPPAIAPPRDPVEFGVALAAAALTQTREFVVYNDKYRRIAYPMGDVPSFYGVCTDVLIRAYRTLSIDLQALVQQTRSGSGDPNIDHRRVDTLQRFFAAHGQSIPITEFAEDYQPGDIVSYWRPQNRHSRTHIAIVASEIGPSGRPMIIHNRGWGPQLEDGLFVDQITGHYRFTGLRTSSAPAATPPRGAAKSASIPLPLRRPSPSKAAALTANATH